jgi:hypothetical protein
MKLKITTFNIDVLNDQFNFNWAKIAFSMETEDGGDFSSKIDVKVPKTIATITDIQAYALDRIRNLDLKSL